MANPLGSNKPLSREELVKAYKLKVCYKCRAEESSVEQRFMVCGGCEGRAYCSKECQRADWPDHKAECKLSQAAKAKMQAHGVAEIGEQFQDWAKHRRRPITLMMCGMLGKQARTHVLRITVDHQPTQKLPFKAVAYRTVPIAELQPQMAETIRTGLQPTPQDAQAKGEWGCAVIDCPASKSSYLHMAPVYTDVSRQATPQEIAACMELLNMDADEALALLASSMTG